MLPNLFVIGILAIKLDHSIERNSLEIYKKQLLTFGDSFCFYCNKKIEKRGSHVDHFIPWSFVKNDKIWNFVLSCDNCNKKKNDRLANKNYLNKLILRNSKYLNESFSKELNELYDSALHNGFAIWDKK